jgi:serine/threonine protein kinase
MKVVAEVQYEKVQQIGVGQGMNSEVFLANDPQLGGRVAVKEIAKANLGNSVSDYFQEAKAMFATSHPNIVPIHYACQTPVHIALAMPYFPNGSLASRIDKDPLPIVELVRVAQGLLLGVAQIHRLGFIHFDLKPSNVLFDNSGAPLVADFGQSRRILPGGCVAVPPMYRYAIPPETLLSSTGSVLSDVYQAGLLLYRAVNGDKFYQAQLANLDIPAIRKLIIAGRLPNRQAFQPHVPKKIRTIIRKALQVNPAKRYQSVTELSAAVARVPTQPNWITTTSPNGEVRWRADRSGKSALEVELFEDANAWGVKVWTVEQSARAKDRASNWRDSLPRAAAVDHLTEVFARLF